MVDGPSAHLSWSELACHDAARTPYPEAWRSSRAARVARAFEVVRSAVGVPLIVLSGYRTPEHNRLIGGALESQHVEGRAVDIRPVGSVSVAFLHAVVLAIAQSLKDGDGFLIRGVGRYPGFVHLDVRPTAALVRWSGVGVE